MPMTEAQLRQVKATGIKGPAPNEPRYPFPVPNGWFGVAQSNDLGPGETKNGHYFGRNLVIWREAETGTPHVVDAYCAHLGAHLGVGSGSPESHEPGPGLVRGNCLECPFHGWRYDGSGTVVEIPYAPTARIPAKAKVRGYPTVEKNGLILAWYHALDEPPMWELPDLPEFADSDWVGPIYTERYIDAALQELMENDLDHVHFVYVHGADEPPEQETIFHGHKKTTRALRPDGGEFTRESQQMGYGILHVGDVVTFVAASSPIDEAHVHQRWVFSYRASIGEEMAHNIIDRFAKAGIYQDIPIWENKRYVPQPVLVKGDGKIMEFRRWCQQFYTWPETNGSDGVAHPESARADAAAHSPADASAGGPN
jgi:phenylpropionate dioxygenase-like ring-hydroxylating dioxygenase large terminal subunit